MLVQYLLNYRYPDSGSTQVFAVVAHLKNLAIDTLIQSMLTKMASYAPKSYDITNDWEKVVVDEVFSCH